MTKRHTVDNSSVVHIKV